MEPVTVKAFNKRFPGHYLRLQIGRNCVNDKIELKLTGLGKEQSFIEHKKTFDKAKDWLIDLRIAYMFPVEHEMITGEKRY